MTYKDCKNCDKCITVVNDNFVWYVCDNYDLYIEQVKTCKFKEK